MSKIAVCPKCGSSRRFSEVNTITGLAGVIPEVEGDGSVAVEYAGGTDVDWDSQTAVRDYPKTPATWKGNPCAGEVKHITAPVTSGILR